MKEIAWIGVKRDFEREFPTRNGEFYDKENDTMYYCIATEYNARGRRFDEVIQGFWGERYDYYNSICQEIVHTRMKKGATD